MRPLFFVFLFYTTACTISSARPWGSCTSPMECNAEKCYDCKCENSACVCADGWSGDNCQTPFCVSRANCSNHGNCDQTLHNMTCDCDPGFKGQRCEASKCEINCSLHGGVPNSACTQCDRCKGAWTGATDEGLVFYALGSSIQNSPVNLYSCGTDHIYSPTPPKAAPPCTLEGFQFNAALPNTTGAVPVYEFYNPTTNDHTYQRSPVPPDGYGPAADAPVRFHAFASANATTGNARAIYSSRLCMDGWCDTMLTPNTTYRKSCSFYDHSVGVNNLLAEMNASFLAALEELNSTLPENPLCQIGQECVGWGVDQFDGRVTMAPLVHLTLDPTDPTTLWHKFVAPKNVKFQPFTNLEPTAPPLSPGVYPLPSDYVARVGKIVGKNTGLRGIYSTDWRSILTSYYDSPADEALSAVQAHFALYSMQISALQQMDLDRHFFETVQALPQDYSTDDEKKLWNRFFSLYGTNVVTESTSGGIIEQRTRWKTPLINKMDKTTLLDNAQIDFSATTGVGGHGGHLDPTYAANRLLDAGKGGGFYDCFGGDPSKCTGTNITDWQDSLIYNTVLLSYSTKSISQLLSSSPQTSAHPSLRVAMEAAVTGYIAMKKAEWKAVNKCPKAGCNGRGTCSPPAEKCACSLLPPKGSTCSVVPPIGRMCSVPGAIGGTRTIAFQLQKKTPETKFTAQCINGMNVVKGPPDPKHFHPYCNTDSRGRVQVVADMHGGQIRRGPWSTSADSGGSSAVPVYDVLGHKHNYLATCSFP